MDFRITGKWYDNGEIELQENSKNDRINTYSITLERWHGNCITILYKSYSKGGI